MPLPAGNPENKPPLVNLRDKVNAAKLIPAPYGVILLTLEEAEAILEAAREHAPNRKLT